MIKSFALSTIVIFTFSIIAPAFPNALASSYSPLASTPVFTAQALSLPDISQTTWTINRGKIDVSRWANRLRREATDRLGRASITLPAAMETLFVAALALRPWVMLDGPTVMNSMAIASAMIGIGVVIPFKSNDSSDHKEPTFFDLADQYMKWENGKSDRRPAARDIARAISRYPAKPKESHKDFASDIAVFYWEDYILSTPLFYKVLHPEFLLFLKRVGYHKAYDDLYEKILDASHVRSSLTVATAYSVIGQITKGRPIMIKISLWMLAVAEKLEFNSDKMDALFREMRPLLVQPKFSPAIVKDGLSVLLDSRRLSLIEAFKALDDYVHLDYYDPAFLDSELPALNDPKEYFSESDTDVKNAITFRRVSDSMMAVFGVSTLAKEGLHLSRPVLMFSFGRAVAPGLAIPFIDRKAGPVVAALGERSRLANLYRKETVLQGLISSPPQFVLYTNGGNLDNDGILVAVRTNKPILKGQSHKTSSDKPAGSNLLQFPGKRKAELDESA